MRGSLARHSATICAVVASACSSGAPKSDAAVTAEVGQVARICEGDASADLGPDICWALAQLTTRTGCVDTHCQSDGGLIVRNPDFAVCGIAPPPADGGTVQSLLGEVQGALAVDDDRCEFRSVVVPVCTGASRSLFFDAELFSMEGGAVPPGAAPYVEAFSGPTHLAPSTGTSIEMAPGRYRIGPVAFDLAGRWTVTIHFFGTCRDDLVNSPHGHMTLTLQVP